MATTKEDMGKLDKKTYQAMNKEMKDINKQIRKLKRRREQLGKQYMKKAHGIVHRTRIKNVDNDREYTVRIIPTFRDYLYAPALQAQPVNGTAQCRDNTKLICDWEVVTKKQMNERKRKKQKKIDDKIKKRNEKGNFETFYFRYKKNGGVSRKEIETELKEYGYEFKFLGRDEDDGYGTHQKYEIKVLTERDTNEIWAIVRGIEYHNPNA